MKRLTSLGLLLVLMLAMAPPAFASYTTDYQALFDEKYGDSTLSTGRSPFRTSTGADEFVGHHVNGPNNQPRYINGTKDVHDGTDLQASAGTYIYPLFNCKVVQTNAPTSTSNNGYVIVQLDVNGDGIYDNYYIKYMHTVPTVSVNDTRSATQALGYVDTAKSWPAHLHLQDTNNTSMGIGDLGSKKLFRYFRSVQAWGYGYYMDMLAFDYIDSSNNLYISINSFDDGYNYPPASIELYYRIGTGAWVKSNTSFNTYLTGNSSGDYYRYNINLQAATGASGGQTIYFYLAGIRTEGMSGSDYNWALWPQYYKRPNHTPSQIAADGHTAYTYTYTIR